MSKIKILETKQVYQKLDRLAYELLEHTFNEKQVFIAGIEGNGYVMAKLLASRFKKISGKKLPQERSRSIKNLLGVNRLLQIFL